MDLFSGKENFHLVGYSFGTLLTLELAKLLESKGKKGSVTLIDGSPQFVHKLANLVVPVPTDENIQGLILLTCTRLLFPDEFQELAKTIFTNKTWETQLAAFVEVGKTRSQYSAGYGSKMLTALINRIKISLNADKINLPTLSSTPLSLVKPTQSSAKDFDEDYGLSKFATQKIKIDTIEGDHTSILSNPELIKLLNH